MRLLPLLLAASLLLTACAPKTPPPQAAPTAVIVPPPTKAAPDAPPAPYRIQTREAGVYRLTPSDLEDIGFGETPPTSLRLSNRGQPWPFAYTQDGLYFYAPALQTRYTNRNTFLLWGDGTQNAALTPQPLPEAPAGNAPAICRARLRLEENRLYEPKAAEGDHWLWQKLVAPATWEQTFTPEGLLPGGGTLTVTLWANTGRAYAPEGEFDHHWRVTLNGQSVAEETWGGDGLRVLTATLPAGLLREGENTLTLEGVADSGLPADIVTLDRVEVAWPQAPSAREGMLECTVETEGELPAAGLDGEYYLWDVTDPQNPQLFRGRAGSGTPFEAAARHRYVLHTPKGARSPLSLQPLRLSPDLSSPENATDYLVIGAPPLLEAAQPLLEHRAAQGLTPLAVPLQAAYDQFSEGVADPEAIRSLLRYAAENWATPPRYVLLIGDYTYDTYGYRTSLAYPLPGFMVYTQYGGETVSDVLFAQLDDDDLPDIAVGRIPAQTPEQVQTYVAKVLAFETQSGGEWRKRVLAVADGQEEYFTGDAQTFLDFFSGEFTTELYAPPADVPDSSQETLSRLGQGDLLVAYFGHGSLTQWGKDRIFTTEEAAALQNADRLPIVVNMTCLTGLFTHPKVNSLAETLLFAPEGGAAAVLAPTSLTLASDQSFLSAPFARAFLENTSATLGDVFLSAQRQVPAQTPGSRDVLLTFLYFGDPALRVR